MEAKSKTLLLIIKSRVCSKATANPKNCNNTWIWARGLKQGGLFNKCNLQHTDKSMCLGHGQQHVSGTADPGVVKQD